MANFTLAVDKNLARDKKLEFEQKGQPTADFIRIVVWGKSAENCANYLAKGRLIAVNGSIQTSTYQTNTGETRYSTDILANHVEFLEWGDKDNAGGERSRENRGNAYEGKFGVSDFGGSQLGEAFPIGDDDDIPF